jgi:hypothetical protein
LDRSRSEKYADVVHLDLLQGTSFSVFLHRVPDKVAQNWDVFNSHFSVKICGDFVSVQVGQRYHEHLSILKLSTQYSRSFSMKEVRRVLYVYSL